jgi:hypothetical protein
MRDFMDATLTYRLQDNILFLKAKHDCTVQEFFELLKIALNDPRLPLRFGIIIDARHSAICPRIADLKQIHDEYASGKLTSGEIKDIACKKMAEFMEDFTHKLNKAKSQINKLNFIRFS